MLKTGAATETVREILRDLLREARRAEELLPGLPDADAVHDFRVAQRRARVALSTYRSILPPSARDLGKGLRWLGRRTGPVRDADVLIDRLAELEARYAEAGAGRVRSLARVLADDRRAAFERLEHRMQTERYADIWATWEALSEAGHAPGSAAPGQNVKQLTSRAIQVRYERLCRSAALLDVTQSDAEVHEARITAKSLRYLLEFLARVEPSATRDQLVAGLKRMQDRLGAFQDDVVHGQLLAECATARGPAMPADARREALRLAAMLAARRARDRGRCIGSLRRFTGPATARRVARITGASREAPA